jgi:hypothetical protein
MVLASRKTRGHFHGFVCFSKPPYVVTCAYLERVAQDALVLLQRVKDEGKLSVFLQPHHFGVHQGGRQWLSSNVYTNQHEATVFETV